jgi:hypothetical protein
MLYRGTAHETAELSVGTTLRSSCKVVVAHAELQKPLATHAFSSNLASILALQNLDLAWSKKLMRLREGCTGGEYDC